MKYSDSGCWCKISISNCDNNPVKLSIEQHDQIVNKNKINEFDSATEAAAFYNIHVNNITCCCRNPKKKSRGFYWRYKIDVLKE
jgi:hypothetical protein